MESINSLPFIETNEVSIRRHDPEQITSKGKTIKIKSNPIFRNNYFIICYNSAYNKVDGISMKRLPRNKLYYFCFPILSIKYFFLQVIFAFIPYFNILWALFLIFMWIIYERAYSVYRENTKKVRNPFAKMVFESEQCKFYKCMNKFLEVPADFLIFHDSLRAATSERVTIMIYNENFRKMQTQFPIYRYLHIGHVILSTFIILISYFLLYSALAIDKLIFIT